MFIAQIKTITISAKKVNGIIIIMLFNIPANPKVIIIAVMLKPNKYAQTKTIKALIPHIMGLKLKKIKKAIITKLIKI